MNTTPNNHNDSQEIDLSQISKKIGKSYQDFLSWIFNCVQFILKNIIYFVVLGLTGLIIGYFLDKGNKTYEHQIYVKPNFGVTDLLYSKIDLLEAKLKERDTMFFKSIGVKKPKLISKIEIEPIVDVYGLVNQKTTNVSNAQNTQNFELLKLLSESSDIKEIIKEDLTGRNYGTHLIHVTTKGKTSKQGVIDPILKYLNDEEFYKKIQKEYIATINTKIVKNEEVIQQIDVILNEFGSKTTTNQKSDKLIYYNENTQLNELIDNKNNLIASQGLLKVELLTLTSIVEEKSTVLNIRNIKSIFLKMKFIIPVLLILGFILIHNMRLFYLNQLSKSKENS